MRFSLRELLLAMLVCAVFAAWAHQWRESRQPLEPSHVAEYFTNELSNDVIAARSATGEKGAAWLFGLDACMDLKGVYKAEHSLNREWFCELRLPWTKAQAFHDDLIRRVDSHIRRGQPGEHVSASEHEAEIKAATTDSFMDVSKYHCGDVHGTIRVYVTRTSDQTARVIAAVSEHRVR